MKHYPKLYLPLVINGKELSVELDTGADCTVLDETFFKRELASEEDIVTKAGETVKDFTGRELSVAGKTDLGVNYAGRNGKVHSLRLTELVFRNCGYDVLLGRDFCLRTNIIMDVRGYAGCGTPNNDVPPNKDITLSLCPVEVNSQNIVGTHYYETLDEVEEEGSLVGKEKLFTEETISVRCGVGVAAIGAQLTSEERAAIIDCLAPQLASFGDTAPLGDCDSASCEIRMGQELPIHTGPLRRSFREREREEIEEVIKRWLEL